jgi:hypothetical protein
VSGLTGIAANRLRACARTAAGVVLYALALTGPVQAHGFAARYDLPIPLWLYLVGAGLTVLLSFAVLALFMRNTASAHEYWRFDLMRTALGRVLCARAILLCCRTLGVALYLLVIAAGIFGAQSPLKNIAPVMVWAIWWVGMAYVSALLGNLWALFNPLDTLFKWAESLYARLSAGRSFVLGLRYPRGLDAWPAVVLFLVFVWMEVVWEHSDHPASLALAILAYSGLTWLGMLLFGREQWLSRGEVFSLVFGLLARFAPLEFRGGGVTDRELNVRSYAVGLLSREPVSGAMMALALAMLAAVSFDGFTETPLWTALLESYAPLTTAAAPASAIAWILVQSAGVFGAPLLFIALYLLFCRVVAWFGGASIPSARIARVFVLTLVPIAIAYHLAHYLSFLALAGQYVIPLASDPFGVGWDLFGTNNYFVRIGLVDARAVWYISVGAIVIGHVAAVYLAHRVALVEFPDRHSALRSQWPMLVLMVCYTMLSLWIISQPIVTSRFG